MACVRMWICDGCGKQHATTAKERSATPPGWTKLTASYTNGAGMPKSRYLSICSSDCATLALMIMKVTA